jgi:hypothetical protein
MARARKKGNIMGTVTKIGALSLGGFVGDKVSGMVEQAIVKQKPELVKYAPAITTALGIIGATYTGEGLVKQGFEGMAMVGLLENFQNIEAGVIDNTTTTTTTVPTTTGDTATTGVNGISRIQGGHYPSRTNGAASHLKYVG